MCFCSDDDHELKYLIVKSKFLLAEDQFQTYNIRQTDFYTLQVLIFKKVSTFDRFSYGNTSLLPIVS